MTASKGEWKLSTVRCKVFRDWSIINLREKVIFTSIDGYISAGTTYTAFVDLVYWCGLEKGILHLDIFNEILFPCRVPTFRGQKVVKHGSHRGISFMFID